MDKFKYTSKFSNCSIISASHAEIEDRYLSFANIDNLKDFELEGVSLEENVDLVLSIFNSAVINRVNKNGDAISTDTALKIKDLFVHKPQNIEHKRNRIVGHIVKTGWSKFQENTLLTEDDIKDSKEPFNLVLAGVVYRAVDPKFADYLVESTDESSEKFRKISASWEIGYDDYVILRAPEDNPETRNVSEMERIEDKEEIKKYTKFLLAKNGSGFDTDGRRIGRLIVGEAGQVLPMGIGFTFNPAAEVEGVITKDWTDLLTEEEVSEKLSKAGILKHLSEDSQEISQNEKTNVKNDTTKHLHSNKTEEFMKIESKEQLLDLIPEESKASAQSFIAEQIKNLSSEHEKAITEKDETISSLQNSLKEAEEKIEKIKGEKEETEASISELKSQVENIQEQAQQERDENNFQNRMTALNEEFELSDAERKVIASKIRGLSEEDYQNWYKEFEIIASEKQKSVIEQRKQELSDKIKEEVAKASKTPTNDDEINTDKEKSSSSSEASAASVLDSASANSDGPPNASDGGVNDPMSEWEEAFGKNIQIKV